MATGQQSVNRAKNKRSHLLLTGGPCNGGLVVQNPITDGENPGVTFNGTARYHGNPNLLALELRRNNDRAVADGGADPADGTFGSLNITLVDGAGNPGPTVAPVTCTYVNDSTANP